MPPWTPIDLDSLIHDFPLQDVVQQLAVHIWALFNVCCIGISLTSPPTTFIDKNRMMAFIRAILEARGNVTNIHIMQLAQPALIVPRFYLYYSHHNAKNIRGIFNSLIWYPTPAGSPQHCISTSFSLLCFQSCSQNFMKNA